MNVYITALDLSTAKKVLLVAEDGLALEDAIEVRRVLNDRFPDVEFTILDGFRAAFVQEGKPDYDIEVEDD